MQRILKQNLRKAIIYDKPRPAARGDSQTIASEGCKKIKQISTASLHLAPNVHVNTNWKNLLNCLKEFAQLSLIHRTHTIGDHFKYKDKQAHLERCNVVYKFKCSCGNSYIGQTQRNLKFQLEEHNPLKSIHQNTDVVKYLYSHPDHFVDLKNPEILASAFYHRELLIKETLLIQEQQPEINVDNFSTPLYLFNT